MKKFEFTIPEKYKEAVEYDESHATFVCGDEGAMFARLLLELENLHRSEQERWMVRNQKELQFEFHSEDLDYAFVDVLTVTDFDGNIVFRDNFLGDGEVEDYLDRIGITEYFRS